MKQNQFEFKPFDKVLVRDICRDKWKVSFYSHYEKDSVFPYACVGNQYAQCIPYNDETEHLRGTTNEYKPINQQKEIKYEVTYGFGEDLTVKSYTEEEFRRFINIAVINNKDIKDFTVNIIIPD